MEHSTLVLNRARKTYDRRIKRSIRRGTTQQTIAVGRCEFQHHRLVMPVRETVYHRRRERII